MIDDDIPIPRSCQRCEKYLTCKEPCSEVEEYARQDYRAGEIPLSDLTTAFSVDEISSTSSIFCGSEDHSFKRQARARVGELNVSLKKEAAIMLLCSTDREYSLDEISVITNVPARQILYLSVKLKNDLGK